MKFPGKKSNMTTFLAALGLKQMATDSEPEEIMDALNQMAAEQGAETKEPAKDADPEVEALKAQVAQLIQQVQQLTKAAAGDEEKKPEDAIDEAISELEKADPAKDDGEEESHTIPAEQMDEAGPVAGAEDRPKSALTGDNAYKVAALRAIKPVIAAIADPAQRKIAADAAIASINGKPANNTYAQIKPRKPATDSKPAEDPAELGKRIARQHNPHYKERA